MRGVSSAKEIVMRRPKLRAIAIVAASLVLALWAAETLVVKVQSTELRKGPQFFSQALGPLRAGDRLEKVSESAGWIQVKTATGALGWVHSSAVETPKFTLLAMDKSMKTQATANEVYLAGKGFTKEVEEGYRAKHADISYVWVDKMLEIKVGLAQIEDFLKKGKLDGFGEPR
jgi:hypothetical protein